MGALFAGFGGDRKILILISGSGNSKHCWRNDRFRHTITNNDTGARRMRIPPAFRTRQKTVAAGRSVMFHDDSQDRPMGIHIILVNSEKSSTTLVISRAKTKSEMHIAWAHYSRF